MPRSRATAKAAGESFTCEHCGATGPMPVGRGTRVKKYCSPRCKARARTAASQEHPKQPVPCRQCGAIRLLAHPERANGMCRVCAARVGSQAAAAQAVPAGERFMSFVEAQEDGCWAWRGDLQRNGYGSFTSRGTSYRAHRFAYEMFVGAIPDGLQLDHLCRVRHCVNPEHLEPVTARENARRAMRTHCTHGHEFTSENTYVHDGKRYCRECRRTRNRNRWRTHAAD